MFSRVYSASRSRACRAIALGSSALVGLTIGGVTVFVDNAQAQVKLPEVVVSGAKPKPRPRSRVAPRPAVAVRAAPVRVTPESAAAVKNNTFDAARNNLYTIIGTTSDMLSHEAIQTLPQGSDQPVEKVLLQAPGVSQDSAASGALHVRNDHANVQFRINGVMLPDGVTGFGTILDTALIGNMSLVTGALPAEFGMRTVGLVDITTRNDVFNNSGSVGVYGGSQGTFQPSFEYGGTVGGNCPAAAPVVAKAPSGAASDCLPGVQYFFTGRYLQTDEGIENPTPAYHAIHDFSQQGRGFAYMSSFIDPVTRLTLIAGTSTSTFQIPNNPGQPLNPIVAPAFGLSTFNSSNLNENQFEDTQFAVLALQRSVNGFDGQLSYFTRYNYLHYTPDLAGDLLINGISSDIVRRSFTNGIQGDASYVIDPAHTVRAGYTVSGENIFVGNTSVVEPCTLCDGSDSGPPISLTDNVASTGWLAGVYAQDEWRLTDKLTMNYGLRFDQMWQFVSANQLSPRVNFTYKPFKTTTFHAGYARYFTPPVLVEAAPANFALFNNTTGAVPVQQGNPVLPERSHYFDVGVDQKVPLGCVAGEKAPNCSVLDLGVDAYYKLATDLIDNGTFGQALVLSGFNYAKAINQGIEFSVKYTSGNFQAYANLAWAAQRATQVVSNQYLFDPDELAYIQNHWINTDHSQLLTGSAGASYRVCNGAVNAWQFFDTWCGTRFSADMIYGSGLRSGFANLDHVAPYAQFNVGVAREFLLPNDPKAVTVRFDIVNLLDSSYVIRDGSGIGVFAPQYGPRRGYFVGVSKKI
jgi:outer membrane receptor protein involved in Fe transport